MKGMYILEEGKPVECEDLHAFMAWMEAHAEQNVVGATHLGDCDVHTCFLGMDLGAALRGTTPRVFETAVFDGPNREGDILHMERCTTWEQAVAMHARAVDKFKVRDAR